MVIVRGWETECWGNREMKVKGYSFSYARQVGAEDRFNNIVCGANNVTLYADKFAKRVVPCGISLSHAQIISEALRGSWKVMSMLWL